MNLKIRPRRNRSHPAYRHWRTQARVSYQDLVYPLFVVEGQGQKQPIAAMPGQFRWSTDTILSVCEQVVNKGVPAIALFPAVEDSLKTSDAKEALNPDNLIRRTVKAIKSRFPDLLIFSDIALDPYNSDGHDGLVQDGVILNDETVAILAQMAILDCQAGVDGVAPSDMMDGRVGKIRQSLDENQFSNKTIISYTAKYASSFYGPFREALDSAPRGGDKKTYQMSPGSKREALLEAQLDFEEGADILMVKPGLPYLDIISDLKHYSTLPIAAYNVSGEYSMVLAAAEKGWIQKEQVIGESLLSFKRAGADLIFTYFALHDFERDF